MSLSRTVGRGGLEPPYLRGKFALERCASERERPSVRRDVMWPEADGTAVWAGGFKLRVDEVRLVGLAGWIGAQLLQGLCVGAN
jgi:hypothetical protein